MDNKCAAKVAAAAAIAVTAPGVFAALSTPVNRSTETLRLDTFFSNFCSVIGAGPSRSSSGPVELSGPVTPGPTQTSSPATSYLVISQPAITVIDANFSSTKEDAFDVDPGPVFATPEQPISQITVSFTRVSSLTEGTSAVPEPAGWVAMLLGFGLLGAEIRRRAAHDTATRSDQSRTANLSRKALALA